MQKLLKVFFVIALAFTANVAMGQSIFSNPINDGNPSGYNPYTNEWEEWSTNPLKQKAIEYYGMQDLVKRN